MEEVLKRISSSLPSLTPKHRAVAEYVLRRHEKVAFMTADELGREVDASTATVIRCAMALGFDGYPALQKALQEMVTRRLTTIDRLMASSDSGDGKVYERVMRSDLKNLTETLAGINEKTFGQAVDSIIRARTIHIVALRSAMALGMFMGYSLQLIRQNTRVLSAAALDHFEQLLGLSPDDLVIGISFPRYTRQTVEIVRLAKERGVPTLVITDSFTSPLAQLADVTLTAKSELNSYVDSFVAPLSLINALATAVALQEKTKAIKALEELEELWKRHHLHADPF